MAANFYFNNFDSSQEQTLIEDLIIESIKIFGLDVYYLPRTVVNTDTIFREDDISKYEDAVLLEMYVKNVDGFAGEGDFLSKFGLEIRDEITLTVAKRIYEDEVYYRGFGGTTGRPEEGDLIYFPFNQKLFQIKFVEHEAVFYQMGSLQTYDLVCELFEYSDETIDTDITVIDNIEINNSQKRSIYLTDVIGNFTVGETVSQQISNNTLTAEVVTVTANTEANNAYTVELINFKTTDLDYVEFVADTSVVGGTSSANGNVTTVNNTVLPTSYQNDDFQSEPSGFLDFSELDPFSEGNY